MPSDLANPIRIISQKITIAQLKIIAKERFGDLAKGVIDVNKGIMAIGGELHADEEAVLLEQGSKQADLWGINLYPDKSAKEMLEYDSMINIRPSQNNRSRGVESKEVRHKIEEIIKKLIG